MLWHWNVWEKTRKNESPAQRNAAQEKLKLKQNSSLKEGEYLTTLTHSKFPSNNSIYIASFLNNWLVNSSSWFSCSHSSAWVKRCLGLNFFSSFFIIFLSFQKKKMNALMLCWIFLSNWTNVTAQGSENFSWGRNDIIFNDKVTCFFYRFLTLFDVFECTMRVNDGRKV